MILSLKKLQANSAVLTLQDAHVQADILFSFDTPVAMGILDAFAVLKPEERVRRTMTTHIDHWISKAVKPKELSTVELDNALRRVLLRVEDPASEETVPVQQTIEKESKEHADLLVQAPAAAPMETPMQAPANTNGLDSSKECPVCFEPIADCVCLKTPTP